MKTYYNDKNFSLFKGDSLKLLKEFPDNHFDMIFADPPYMLSNGGFTVQAGKRACVNKGNWDKSNGFDSDFSFQNAWIKEAKRILKPNGTLWVSGTYHSIYQCGYALQLNKYHILNDISWFKPNAAPNLSCRFFTASHESLIWARKEKSGKHIFNYEKIKAGNWKEDALKKPGLQMRSVWSINTPKATEKTFGKHPTQKPFDLMRRVIIASTNKGDLVLDPFTGSSTTGLAAVYYGRKFYGIDIEKKYLDLSIKRYEELRSKIK